MLLAIDVGNTNSVFSVSKNKKILSEWRCSTDGNMTADQYFTWLQQLFNIANINYKEIKVFHDKINSEFENINIVNFDGSLWNELGANTSEEIELLALSFLKFYENHQSKNQNEKSINITVSANTDFFTSILKLFYCKLGAEVMLT